MLGPSALVDTYLIILITKVNFTRNFCTMGGMLSHLPVGYIADLLLNSDNV